MKPAAPTPMAVKNQRCQPEADDKKETATEETTDAPNDLPGEDETPAQSNYTVPKGKAKASKANKFDSVFEDEE